MNMRLEAKSHKILAEIQKRHAKEQPKTAKNEIAKIQTYQISMAFGPLTSSFSVEWDFPIKLSLKLPIHKTICRCDDSKK